MAVREARREEADRIRSLMGNPADHLKGGV